MDTTDAATQGESRDALARLCTLVLEGPACRCPENRLEELTEVLARLQEELAERRRREDQLRQRVQQLEESAAEVQSQLLRYRELFEFAPDPYLETDLAGTILDVNHAAAHLFHSPKEFLIGKPLPFYVAFGDRADFFTRLVHMKSHRHSFASWEVRLQPHRCEPLDGALTVTTTLDVEGRPVGFRWQIRDISAHNRLVEALRTEQQFTESLIDTAQVFVLVVNQEDRLVRINAYLQAASGYSREELLDHGWRSRLFPAEALGRLREQLRQAIDSRRGLPITHALWCKDGSRRTVVWRARPLFSGVGLTTALLMIGQDITEVEKAQCQALQLERLAAVGEVTTGLAHESRNALQRGLACLELLRWRLQDQPEPLALVARVKKAQDDLVRLYDDVRSYAAPLTLERSRCDLAAVWREVWQELTSLDPGRQVTLIEDTHGADLVCDADSFRLGQVFRNIFENILAACSGAVRVWLSCQEADLSGQPALHIAVRDNGPGLNEEQKRRLFEPFYTTKVKGTGLGMSIVKRIVEAHGGRIAVGDSPSLGAEIVFHLPRSEA